MQACSTVPEPRRELCATCRTPVLVAVVKGDRVVVEITEWQPRKACQSCQQTRRTWGKASCAKCGGTGYVGEERPKLTMLAIDACWGDEYHVRLVGPSTSRFPGEALHRLHACAVPLAA